ncbi:YggW family oxidoreductase [Wohlfahrtiimonas chitiniclastica]|uniref:radical SAM family heme chaperone HemW n=1 Tax=Wohlfahrtiimonas chitiniclastica TaxID=400946 RepID=UPI000B984095|nr:radical SAM family heme chaperone HemW [Wohlfahrtiimonas chitiniclastica]OYQ79960.1 YggW family oxidoreductase [Wohlfahrtiimonas chitiniclastica]
MIPLSLYIHFPWCIQKCPYCDFNSHQLKTEGYDDDYVNALLEDVVTIVPYIWGRKIRSIFIGGGTPSLMKPEDMARLMSGLRSYLSIDPNAEITIEVNPGTVDAAYFQAYHDLGINRISIGIQSLNDKHLKKLGRIHQADEAKRAVSVARAAGFTNINCDLMFALPDQTLEEALSDLEGVMALAPDHISHYQLTLEPNTFFHKYPPPLPESELVERMQLESYARLAQHGYEHYEVSAFGKAGHQSVHNRNYWEFGDYIGIGAGAHGKITMQGEQKILRTLLEKHPAQYLKKSAAERLTITEVDKEDLPFEFMLNVLRLKTGVPMEYFTARTYLDFSGIDAKIAALQAEGLLQQGQRLATTEKGFLFLNRVLSEFID